MRITSLALVLVLVSAPAFAGKLPPNNTRCSCPVTAEELQSANRGLFLDDQARAASIAEHLPWGEHAATDPVANERLLVQPRYVTRHDGDLRTALWVSYHLPSTQLVKAKRQSCFRRDIRLLEENAGWCVDYVEKKDAVDKYDQGHIAPDADMKSSLDWQIQTYMMSNMAPQLCQVNRGTWLLLEQLTRSWAKHYGELWVVSGSIFDRDGDGDRDPDMDADRTDSYKDTHRVAIPSAFFKILVRRDGDGFNSMAFVIPHDRSGFPYDEDRELRNQNQSTWVSAKIVPIARIEALMDTDFFPDAAPGSITETQPGEPHWPVEGKWPGTAYGTCKPRH